MRLPMSHPMPGRSKRISLECYRGSLYTCIKPIKGFLTMWRIPYCRVKTRLFEIRKLCLRRLVLDRIHGRGTADLRFLSVPNSLKISAQGSLATGRKDIHPILLIRNMTPFDQFRLYDERGLDITNLAQGTLYGRSSGGWRCYSLSRVDEARGGVRLLEP